MSKHIKAFEPTKVPRNSLEKLVNEATILDLEADTVPFTHTNDNYDLHGSKADV